MTARSNKKIESVNASPGFSSFGVAVLGDPLQPPLPLDPDDPARGAALTAATMLAAVPAFGDRSVRAKALGVVASAVGVLVRALGGHSALADGAALPAQSPAQAYFRLRSMTLCPRSAALHITVLVEAGLFDLLEAPLAGSDLARELQALRQALVDMASPGRDGGLADASQREATGATVPETRSEEQIWLSRWIIGHQLHALFSVNAAIAVRDAIRAVGDERSGPAAQALERATVHVKALAAARAHALAIPAEFYLATLRATMVPPLAPVPLSGKMHVEYRSYRESVEELLTVLPASVEDLAFRAPTLAFAREQLLEADLIDAERHVSLVEPLIGNAKSLIQPARSSDNALAVLRRIRDVRANQFAGFIRFDAGRRTGHREPPMIPN